VKGREKESGSGSGTGWAYTWQIMDSEVSMLRSVFVLCLRELFGCLAVRVLGNSQPPHLQTMLIKSIAFLLLAESKPSLYSITH
jgi:hypothetical protein